MRFAIVVGLCVVGCTPAAVAAPAEPTSAPLAPPSSSAAASPTPPDAPPADDAEAALDAALEKRAHGDVDGARTALSDLIRRLPSSPVVPRAYVALGDIAFESLGQPGADPAVLVVAQRAYEAALQTPPPANASYAYAAYKLGWVFYDLSDSGRALASFLKATEAAAKYPDVRGAGALRVQALRDMVLPYSQVGDPRARSRSFAERRRPTRKLSMSLVASRRSTGPSASSPRHVQSTQILRRETRRTPALMECAHSIRSWAQTRWPKRTPSDCAPDPSRGA